MNSQQPPYFLAEFQLPIEEFEDRTIDCVNTSNELFARSAEIRAGPWRRTGTLGQGSYGQVWLQERGVDIPPPHARAVKEVALNQLSKDGIDCRNEISAMARFSKLKHGDYAVFGEFYGYAMDNGTLFLAMEYFPYRDLKRHMGAGTISEQEAKKIVYDILVGLKVMHAEGIVHRDLKPENIFVASKPPWSHWSVKIADFGISKRIPAEGQGSLSLRRGTKYYTAPEAEGWIDPCHENPGAMDMWSLGVIVYSLATNQFPFTPREVVLFCRDDGRFPFPRRPMLERWTEGGLAFVEALLRPLPRDRPSAEEALQHHWIASMSDEPVSPLSTPTTSTSILTWSSPGGAGSSLVIGNQDTESETDPSQSLMEGPYTQSPSPTLSMPAWAERPYATFYSCPVRPDWFNAPITRLGDSCPQAVPGPSLENLVASSNEAPSDADASRPSSPLRTITGPMPSGNEIPSTSSHGFPLLNSASETWRPARSLGEFGRRATAPTLPCTSQTHADSPYRPEWLPGQEVPDLASSTRNMSFPQPRDPPPLSPSQHSSLIRRDTKLRSFPRSMSDSFMRPPYRLDNSHRPWDRASVWEFITDPRLGNSVNALYHAVKAGRDDVVGFLLDRGVSIETLFHDPPHLQYGTALHVAVSCAKADIVKLLLRRGASPRAKAKAKLSKFHMRLLEPLHLAAYHGLEEIACILLHHGARIEANAIGKSTNTEKRTPLHLAVLGDESDEIPSMVHLLLEHGADPNVKDDMGMTPGDYAVMLGLTSLRTDLPASLSGKLKARVVKMRIKFDPFVMAGPLLLGAAGVAMIMK